MVYSSPTTRATGYVVLATNWNEFVNNFIAMAPDAFTTDGDIYVASGANTGVRLAAFTNSTGTLTQEKGGLEFDASGIVLGGLIKGSGTGTFGLLTLGSALAALRVNAGGTDLEFGTFGTEATQADMEDEGVSNANRFVSPEVAKNAPSAAKVWVKWEQAGAHSLLASYNMTSVTDGSAVGTTDHLWATDFSSAEYGMASATEYTTSTPEVLCPQDASFAAGGVTTETRETSVGSLVDNDHNSMAIFGDQ